MKAKLMIEIAGVELKLTKEEAKELRDELNGFIAEIPNYQMPYIIPDCHPLWPEDPVVICGPMTAGDVNKYQTDITC